MGWELNHNQRRTAWIIGLGLVALALFYLLRGGEAITERERLEEVEIFELPEPPPEPLEPLEQLEQEVTPVPEEIPEPEVSPEESPEQSAAPAPDPATASDEPAMGGEESGVSGPATAAGSSAARGGGGGPLSGGLPGARGGGFAGAYAQEIKSQLQRHLEREGALAYRQYSFVVRLRVLSDGRVEILSVSDVQPGELQAQIGRAVRRFTRALRPPPPGQANLMRIQYRQQS